MEQGLGKKENEQNVESEWLGKKLIVLAGSQEVMANMLKAIPLFVFSEAQQLSRRTTGCWHNSLTICTCVSV